MPDYTSLELAKMEQVIYHTYTKAQKEIQEKWDKYMAKAQPKVDKAQAVYAQAMLHGTVEEMAKAKTAYEKAVLNMTLQNKHYQAMVNQVTDKLADTNQVALDYLNGQMPKVYCHNFNEFANEKIKGYSFELVNEETVKNLIKDGNKSLLPQKQLNIPKDKQWNTKNINSQVLQGILQGESIGKISKRLQNVTDMNYNAAVRNARTMTTGAENKGRQDSFVRATNDGIIIKRRWVAANQPERTREWHADLNGVEVDVDKPFENDYGQIMYPGDPEAHPANIYNCRCSIRAVVKGFKPVEKPVGIYAQQYKDVGMTKQYYAMLDENKALGNEFWKTLKTAGKPSEVWSGYILGTGSKTVAKQLDDILAKYKGTGKPIKPGSGKKVATVVQKPKPDLGMYQDKSMTATYYSVKAEDKALGKEFWDVIQTSPSPSVTWNQYLIGTAPQDITEKLDAILLQHKGTGAWSKPVSAKAAAKKAAKTTETVKTAKVTVDTDDLEKAKEQLAVAQGNLDSIKNKTYTGIWKEPVSLSDYEAKAGSIVAKKQWYYDEIDNLQHKIDTGFYENEGGIVWAKDQITKYEKYIDDLIEFENQGKLYAQYTAEYKKAFDEVKKLTPVGETFGPDAYSQARKNMALWAKNNTEYNTLDKYYDKIAKKVHGARTDAEYDGYYHYTWGSMPFNSPLAGYKGDRYTNFVGVNKVDINVGGYGEKIRGLTSLIEKSTYDQDIWVQSAQGEITLETFLGLKPGTLHNMSLTDAKQFIGVENKIPQFISGAIEKGGGSYNPGDMTFNIYCPSGSEVLYVRSDGRFGKGEKEMILQRGGTYKVTDIYRGKGTHGQDEWIVDLELHPENGYDKFQQTK